MTIDDIGAGNVCGVIEARYCVRLGMLIQLTFLPGMGNGIASSFLREIRT